MTDGAQFKTEISLGQINLLMLYFNINSVTISAQYTDRWQIRGKTWINDWRSIMNAEASIQGMRGHWMV